MLPPQSPAPDKAKGGRPSIVLECLLRIHSAWLVPQPMTSLQSALSTSSIQDIDTTIKPLHGKQDGAQVSYKPHKPGKLEAK